MNTFLPYPDFAECARVLDTRRLGKQIIECRQILKAILDPNYGWQNHPAVNMWRGSAYTLSTYLTEMASEWLRRRGKVHGAYDNFLDNEFDLCVLRANRPPAWLGDERLHSSHRANLLRKDPVYYGQFGWKEEPVEKYWWPTQSEDYAQRAGWSN